MICRSHCWTLNKSSEYFHQTLGRQTSAVRRLYPIAASGFKQQYAEFAAKKDAEKEPIEAKVLTAILKSSATPYSSYVPAPRGVLHDVHATIKQAYLVVLLLITGRSQSPFLIAGGVLLLTIVSLPPRLWKAQLKRLGLLALFLYVTTALFADGLPAAQQSRHVPHDLEGLPALAPPGEAYKTVLFHFLFITVTRKSLQLAQSVSCLTFSALQAASLCLTTTPPEELAMGLKFWLTPFRLVGANVEEMSLTLLLSLRFLAVVFEEIRNLALGLAARNLQWKSMGRGAGVQVSLKMLGRLFGNLMKHSSNIAVAMKARGFTGPKEHRVVFASDQTYPLFTNLVASLALCGMLLSTLI